MVADRVRPTDKAAHKYSWRLHGFGGGSSIRKNYEVGTFKLSTEDALWTRKKASLKLVLDSTAGKPALKTALFPHEWKSSWEGYHNLVDGEVTTKAGAEDIAFLGVVFPRPAGKAMPTIKVHEAAADTACISITDQGFTALMATRVDGKTDATFAWIAPASDGTVNSAFMRGGKTLSYGGKVIINNTTGAATSVYPKGK